MFYSHLSLAVINETKPKFTSYHLSGINLTVTFETERSTWIETPKNSEKITTLPQLKLLNHFISIQLATVGRLQQSWKVKAPTMRTRMTIWCKVVKTNVSTKRFHFEESAFSTKINCQIIPHQAQLIENPLIKALALTSPFNVVYIIHLLKLRQQVSTSVFL